MMHENKTHGGSESQSYITLVSQHNVEKNILYLRKEREMGTELDLLYQRWTCPSKIQLQGSSYGLRLQNSTRRQSIHSRARLPPAFLSPATNQPPQTHFPGPIEGYINIKPVLPTQPQTSGLSQNPIITLRAFSEKVSLQKLE